ncbi:cyclic nucleotide-binding/CBS domain-containing protein, partial [Chloroflexota bacterium]
KVKDMITNDVFPVDPCAPVMVVSQQILKSGQDLVPVCDNGKLCGVITARDIAVSIVASARDPVGVYAKSIMTNHFPTISPDDEILDAARLMVDRVAQMLLVIENGIVVGLLTLKDLARESPALAVTWSFVKP